MKIKIGDYLLLEDTVDGKQTLQKVLGIEKDTYVTPALEVHKETKEVYANYSAKVIWPDWKFVTVVKLEAIQEII